MDPASIAAAVAQGLGAIGEAVDPYIYTEEERAQTGVDTLRAQADASAAAASASSAAASAAGLSTAAKWGAVALLALAVGVLVMRRR